MIPGTWSVDPVVLSGAALALAMYGRAFVELRRLWGSDHAQILNAVIFVAGVIAGALALVSPIDALAEDTLLSAHMLQHLLLGDVAPMLLVLGVRGPIAFFFLPASRATAARESLQPPPRVDVSPAPAGSFAAGQGRSLRGTCRLHTTPHSLIPPSTNWSMRACSSAASCSGRS